MYMSCAIDIASSQECPGARDEAQGIAFKKRFTVWNGGEDWGEEGGEQRVGREGGKTNKTFSARKKEREQTAAEGGAPPESWVAHLEVW